LDGESVLTFTLALLCFHFVCVIVAYVCALFVPVCNWLGGVKPMH